MEESSAPRYFTKRPGPENAGVAVQDGAKHRPSEDNSLKSRGYTDNLVPLPGGLKRHKRGTSPLPAGFHVENNGTHAEIGGTQPEDGGPHVETSGWISWIHCPNCLGGKHN